MSTEGKAIGDENFLELSRDATHNTKSNGLSVSVGMLIVFAPY
jgi:hypothetical protein